MKKKSESSPLRTCVCPAGKFIYGLHQPHFKVANLREKYFDLMLGSDDNGNVYSNHANFPAQDVNEPAAGTIFEIANPFGFRGVTFINKPWADRMAQDPSGIKLPRPEPVSFHHALKSILPGCGSDDARLKNAFAQLPDPLKLSLATTSADPEDLIKLAELSCRFSFDETTGRPNGLHYAENANGSMKQTIFNEKLFDSVANNPYLPDDYKEVMVLRPGVQGSSEIVGDWQCGKTHIFEYLRRNSYIPWGHYAANMAHNTVRYAVADLTDEDVTGLRHLYYQRTYVRLAQILEIEFSHKGGPLDQDELEQLRQAIQTRLNSKDDLTDLPFSATLWGWNYGFDYAAGGYRLHASHQQIHQQFALIANTVPLAGAGPDCVYPPYSCGDMIHDCVVNFRRKTGKGFFECYQKAIRTNTRMDGKSQRPDSLVIYEDKNIMLYVPKAQTSQWELQVMTTGDAGNILEADSGVRAALDRAILTAMLILTGMGARLITVIEYSKRFWVKDKDQKLIYAFLPKLPESPGAFSEAQLRWINGHYPEDFAQACRLQMDKLIR
ncbi:MAG: hypothetical protein GY874_14830 [Desulfobacteraceae bacterium]|nr:hypothetical protein [Desulfobacteraceae bacterium]